MKMQDNNSPKPTVRAPAPQRRGRAPRIVFAAIAGALCLGGSAAVADSRIVGAAMRNAWGDPGFGGRFTQNDPNAAGFRLREGWGCCDNPTNQDDQAIIAFIAFKIVENGGYFCPEMISTASSSDSRWSLWQEPTNMSFRCRWLCEPGWEGENCAGKTSDTAACDTATFSKEAIVSGDTYNGDNGIAITRQTPNNASQVQFFGVNWNNGYEYVIFLGAIGFHEHGITAAPVIVGSTGGHPKTTYLNTQKASGHTKKLCAAGFSKPDCQLSSSKCGIDLWCSGWSGFDAAQHEKIPLGNCLTFRCQGGKVFTSATDRTCRDCARTFRQGIGADGLCLTCEKGKYYAGPEAGCQPAKGYAMNVMQYGKNSQTDAMNQCWTKESPDEYKKCLNE